MTRAVLGLLVLLPVLAWGQGAPRTPNLALKFTRDTTTNDNFVRLDDVLGTITDYPHAGVVDRGGQVYNVKAYGATCDGTTDDTAAITSALDAANGKGCVFIPPSTSGCLIASALNLVRDSCLIGTGVSSTLVAGTNSMTMLRLDGGFITVQGLRLRNASGVTGVTGVHVNPDHDVQANFNTLRDLYFLGRSGTLLAKGIYIQAGRTLACAGDDDCQAGSCSGSGDCGAWYTTVDNVRVRYATDAIQLDGTASHLTNGANGTRLSNVRIGHSTTGVRVTRADSIMAVNTAYELNTTGIVIEDSAGDDNNANQFIGARFEANTTDINVGANSYFNTFIVAQPTTAKITDNGNNTAIIGATAQLKLPGITYSDTDAIMHIAPVGGVEFDDDVTFDGIVRDATVTANDIVLGSTSARTTGQCEAQSCYMSVVGPNSSFGFPFTIFGDADNKTLALRSRDFTTATNTGQACTFTMSTTRPGVSCSTSGTSVAAPFTVGRLRVDRDGANTTHAATILSILTNTGTIDFASINGEQCADSTITVTDAVAGDTVMLGVPNGAMVTGSMFQGWVSASNTVTVRHCCTRAAASTCDPASGTFRAVVVRM